MLGSTGAEAGWVGLNVGRIMLRKSAICVVLHGDEQEGSPVGIARDIDTLDNFWKHYPDLTTMDSKGFLPASRSRQNAVVNGQQVHVSLLLAHRESLVLRVVAVREPS